MDYEDIEYGIIRALTDNQVKGDFSGELDAIVSEYLNDEPDGDIPDRYRIGYSLHKISDSLGSIAKSLSIIARNSKSH